MRYHQLTCWNGVDIGEFRESEGFVWRGDGASAKAFQRCWQTSKLVHLDNENNLAVEQDDQFFWFNGAVLSGRRDK